MKQIRKRLAIWKRGEVLSKKKECLKDLLLQLKGKKCQWALYSNGIQYSVTAELKSINDNVSNNGLIIKLKGSGTPYISLIEPVKKMVSETEQGMVYEFTTESGEWLRIGVLD